MPDRYWDDLHEKHRKELLEEARSIGREICLEKGEVSIEDVRPLLTIPDHIDKRVLGSVFRGPDWEFVRYQTGTRASCHNRAVAVFQFVENRQMELDL